MDVPIMADLAGRVNHRKSCSGLVAREVLISVRRKSPGHLPASSIIGIRYAILGKEEMCTGDPARRSGNEFIFQMMAYQNIQP